MDEASLFEAEHRRRAAMQAGDFAALDALIGTPFHYAHISGLVDDRDAYLERITSGQVLYPKAVAEELRAILKPGFAILTGLSTLGYAWTDGSAKGEFQTLFTSTWEWTDEAWRMIAYASTPTGPDSALP